MAELARIHAQKKLACPECRSLLPDWTAQEILGSEVLHCPGCYCEVKLPAEVYQRARQSLNLGRNLDITC